jgi:hypothetical protein
MFGCLELLFGDLYGTSSWCPWIDPSWDRTKAIHLE